MRREKGNYPPWVNEEGWPRLFKRLAAENGFTANDVDQLLFTQISKPSIAIAAERCGVPVEKCALSATHPRTPGLHGVHPRRLGGASGSHHPTGFITADGLDRPTPQPF